MQIKLLTGRAYSNKELSSATDLLLTACTI